MSDYEDPSTYLNLIKNAELVLTTSFHGTIFSTMYRKNFYVLKNGGMFECDDRVATLVKKLSLEDRFISYKFDKEFNYMQDVNYNEYDANLAIYRQESEKFLKESIGLSNEKY